ncbi:hypothetical protein X975_00103, partial [Stegodyphus mimosarum]
MFVQDRYSSFNCTTRCSENHRKLCGRFCLNGCISNIPCVVSTTMMTCINDMTEVNRTQMVRKSELLILKQLPSTQNMCEEWINLITRNLHIVQVGDQRNGGIDYFIFY